jgi:uncharacterized protein YggU (UPF0235/DUF167 family)
MRYTVYVKPGSRKGPLVEANEDGSLTVFLQERPVEGAANEALLKLLALYFNLKPRDIEIESGHTSKIKRIAVKS